MAEKHQKKKKGSALKILLAVLLLLALTAGAAGVFAYNEISGNGGKPGAEVTRDELIAFYEGKTAKWQVPDDVVFVDAIPLGATGKMLKTRLREVLKDYVLPGV